MTGAVDDPLLEDRLPAGVGMKRAAVGVPAGHLAVLHGCLQTRGRGRHRLRDDLIAVARVHRRVLIAMEHDRRNVRRYPSALEALPDRRAGLRALPHGGEGRRHVARGAAGEAGMHADRGVEIGVGRAHDGRRRAAGREPGDIDAPRVDRVVAHDLAGDAGDQRGLARVALLVARAEPVPALRRVRGRRLRRIDDETGVLFGERVHARAGGEVVGRLGAAVQHDDQRQRLPAIAAGDVELVGAAARRRSL